MGFSVSWIAFKGVPKPEVLAVLGLRDTGIVSDLPEEPFQTAVLPDGWTVVFANHVMFAAPDRLQELSRHHIVVGCMVEEHAMVSMSACYAQGQSVWEVVHDDASTPPGLAVSGQPPPALADIRERLTPVRDDSVSYGFDIPIELARTVCGYRHDMCRFPWGEITYTVAVPV